MSRRSLPNHQPRPIVSRLARKPAWQIHRETSVEDLLARARQSRAASLDLSHHNLEEVPAEVSEFTHVVHLLLRGNQIRVVPEWIGKLPNLKRLDITLNPVEACPDVERLGLEWSSLLKCAASIDPKHVMHVQVVTGSDLNRIEQIPHADRLVAILRSLPNLEYLEIGLRGMTSQTPLDIPVPTVELTDLFRRLGQFPKLETLSIFGLAVEEIPQTIVELPFLRHLYLTGTGIRALPAWLADMTQLTRLGIAMSGLEKLPSWFSKLANLVFLNIGENRFAQFPPVLFELAKLSSIDLSANELFGHPGEITEVPSDILRLTQLQELFLEEQPIETPPPEVVARGVEAVKSYWRQQHEEGVDYLCEAKLVIVGEAGAGKTSLAKKLIDPSYVLQPAEASTEGIDVLEWTFPTSLRVASGDTEYMVGRNFRVNIWDFGGQEIYHATHQFFLTRRSVYALVVDDRKEDTDFNYWLQIVELLSGASPLLIVQNEKQDRSRAINLASLRARFANIRGNLPTNLADGRGLNDVRVAIRSELEHLPHIGVPLPLTWNRVREALENDHHNYIRVDDYFSLCDRCGFRRDDDKLQLSSYLHDLGICLHFQDDAVLKNTLILKPRWGTAAVYRVLDDRTVIDQRGHFTDSDLQRIWVERQYSEVRDELFRLMERFELCYRLPGERTYIAPQLLSPLQPHYDWEEAESTSIRYEYDFMPKGLITRLIVALHHLIADQELVWRSGVVLLRNGTRAEVIEDHSRRRITLRVAGPDRRGLIAIVDDQLGRIHQSFLGLRVETFLPCTCPVCKQRLEPFAYPLSALIEFASAGDGIQCQFSRKLVDARRLIMDVFPSAETKPTYSPAPLPENPLPTVRPAPMEVFVSYAWSAESSALVDRIEAAFAPPNVTLIRDRNELKYRDSIRAFMERLGEGRAVIIILSEEYLRSTSCMFELTEIAAAGNLRDRVFPIILEDAKIYDAFGRLAYIRHWEAHKQELDLQMKLVGGENLSSIRQELDLCVKIRATIDSLMDLLGGMNCLTAEQHRNRSFETLIDAIERRLSH